METNNEAESRKALENAWDHLRSTYEISQRKGVDTNWEAFGNRTIEAISLIVTTLGFEPKMPNMVVTAKTFRLPPQE